MLILVNGLPLFAQQIVNDMNAYQSEHRFVFCNTYYSKWGKLKFFLLLPIAGMCISVNGVSDNSAALNWVLRLKKKLVMLWSGTDVLLAQERNANKSLLRKYIDYSVNATDSELLSAELNQLKIPHQMMYFKWLPVEAITMQTYSSILVLSYVAKNKEDFYGWQTIRQAAIDNPSIEFVLVGTDGLNLSLPKNVNCLGWIDKNRLVELYKQCAVFLRLPAHDGFSLSVLEALAYGAEVLWTTPMPAFVTHWEQGEDFKSKLNEVVEKIKARGMCSNVEQQNKICATFSRETVLGNFQKALNNC
jgi:hypothetical protein